MSTTKKCLFSALGGFIIASLLGFGAWKYYPRIIVKKESPTTTTVTKIPVDYEECIRCLKSKGEITQVIDYDNVMTIWYEDGCKKAEKKVTLRVTNPRKNFIIANFTNTFTEDQYKKYGGDVSYYHMTFDRIGVGGGMMANLDEITIKAGVIFNF